MNRKESIELEMKRKVFLDKYRKSFFPFFSLSLSLQGDGFCSKFQRKLWKNKSQTETTEA